MDSNRAADPDKPGGTTAVERVLARLENVRQSGEAQWSASCPSHDDRQNSLSVGVGDDGRVLVRCFAGCEFSDIVEALGLKPKDFFEPRGGDGDSAVPDAACGPSANGEAARDEPPAAKPAGPLTLEQLAADKMLPLEFLRGKPFWCRSLDRGVGISYFPKSQGDKPVTKFRTSLRAKDGSWWPKGEKLQCYGTWLLDRARELGYLILVEGETDVWSLYYHGYPVLGIPGANAVGALKPEYVADIPRVLVVREPLTEGKPRGTGGEAFVAGVARVLQGFGWKGEARAIDLSPTKDPCDLHKLHPTHEAFKAAFDPAMAAARPLADVVAELPPPAPAGARGRKKKAKPVAGAAAAAVKAAEGTKLPYPPGFHGSTDLGNARRLVGQHGRDVKYCFPARAWFYWDGAHWRRDDTGHVMMLAKATVGTIYYEASLLGDEKDRAALAGHAVRSECERALNAMVYLAQSEPGVPVLPADLDRDPFLFNVANGTLDLRTGVLREHRREDMMTKITDVVFDTGHACPLWERCLDRWMGGNKNLVRYLQVLVGHALTGDVSEQSLYFFHGAGANGKTTFLLAVLALLGDYGWQAAPGLLIAKRHESHPTEQAHLFGKRLVCTIETEKGQAIAEALMKQVTGSDQITARFLFKEFFSFDPTHKIILAANHKPVIHGTDLGTWRRVKLVPWDVTIADAEKDKHLVDKLKDELSGILNWAMRGCLGWQRDGLVEPPEVQAATQQYQAEQDMVAGFAAERCVRHPEARTMASKMFEEYGKWAADKLMTMRDFKKRMEGLGFAAKRFTTGLFWLGLKLDTDDSDNLYER
jgi:putative DNA primase/helicase